MNLKELNEVLMDSKVSQNVMLNLQEMNLLPEVLYEVPYEEKDNYAQIIREWRYSFVGICLNKYIERNVAFIVSKVLGKFPEPEDFTREANLEIVDTFLYKEDICQNTARKYCAKVKAILITLSYMHDIPDKGFRRIFALKGIPTLSTYLTQDEIKGKNGIRWYTPKDDVEEVVLAQFLAGCYTGARHSDVVKFTRANINNGYLRYVSQKTKKRVTVKADTDLLRVIEASNMHPTTTRKISDGVFNDTIREICKNCGINEVVKVFKAGKEEEGPKWMFVTSHTARRSFVTNMICAGEPIRNVSLMAGHSGIAMTERYIMSGLQELSEGGKKFFE